MAPRTPTTRNGVSARHRPAVPGLASVQPAVPGLASVQPVVPRLPSRWLARPRLRDALRPADGAPIALVSAPAGFGKTTLLAEWAGDHRGPVAWVSFEGRDAAGGRGWSQVVSSIDHALPPTGQRRTNDCEPAMLSREIERVGGQFTILLDDIDLVTDDVTLDAVGDLVSWMPPAARTILVARSAPSRLALGRWRWQGGIDHVTAATLAFTRDETAAYLRRCWDLDVDDASVERLWRQTDGWPALLRLAASQQRQPIEDGHGRPLLDGDDALVAEFLRAVLAREQTDDADWLLRCSVLDVLDPAACAAVTGDEADARFVRLAEGGLLIRDPRGGWRHRRPLRDLLRRALIRRHPSDADGLWRRAMKSRAQRGDTAAAVASALEAGRVPLALDVLEAHRHDVLAVDGGVTFQRLVRSQDHRLVGARPLLTMTSIDLAALHRDVDGLARVRPVVGPDRTGVPSDAVADAAIHAEASLARLTGIEPDDLAWHPHPRSADAVAYLRGVQAGWDGDHARAEKLLCAARAGTVGREDHLGELVVLVDLAWERACAGRLPATELLLRRVLMLSRSLGVEQPPVHVGLARASLAIDRRQLDVADRLLRRVEARTESAEDVALAVDVLLCRLRIGGRIPTGARMLDALQELAAAHRGRYGGAVARRLARAEANVLLRVGDVDRAAASVPHILVAEDHRHLPPADRVLLARLLWHRGRAARARLVAADVTLGVAGPRLAIEAARIQAAAAHAGGDHAAAAAAGNRGRNIATSQTMTLRRPRAMPVAAARPTASRARPKPVPSDVETVRSSGTRGMVERLTPRERTVLELLPSHLSYQELADELRVSLNTVKSHLKSTYRKLDANSRRDAVERAQELGLLAGTG